MQTVQHRSTGTTVSAATVTVLDPGQQLALAGRLDSRSAHEIRRALDAAIASGRGDLVVDVSAAEVHDSTGLAVVLGSQHRAVVAGRRLVLHHPSERLDRLLRATRAGRVQQRRR